MKTLIQKFLLWQKKKKKDGLIINLKFKIFNLFEI